MKSERLRKLFVILILMLAAVIYLSIFSLGTSWVYVHRYIGWDSDIFLAMGKFCKEGLVPYKDFFDHKGPIIIFIQWLGYVIGDGKPGVFVIQLAFLMMTLLGIYKILSLYYRKNISLCLTVVSLLILNIYFDKGNLTEEYCLPFLMWSVYFSVQFLKGDKPEHKCTQAFLYGITFMIGAMTRLTNSLPVVILTVIILVVMIRAKEWKSIWKNAVGFVSGAMMVLLPIAIYFIKVGALNEMLYATFVYNFKHGFERAPLDASEVLHMTVLAVPFIMSLFIGIVSHWRYKTKKTKLHSQKLKTVGFVVVILSTTAIMFLMISRPYAHYMIVWMPTIILAMGLLGDLFEEKKVFCIVTIVFCGISVLGKVGTAGMEIYSVLKSEGTKEFEIHAKEVVSKIPDSDRDKVIAYNVKAYFYLITDVNPCYKNFNLQELHTRTDEVEMKEFAKDLSSMEAKYIVTGRKDGMYSRFIKEHYKLMENNGTFRLFVKIQN